MTAGLKGRGRTQTQGVDVTVINQLWTSPASEFVSSSIKWGPAIVQLADITELLGDVNKRIFRQLRKWQRPYRHEMVMMSPGTVMSGFVFSH